MYLHYSHKRVSTNNVRLLIWKLNLIARLLLHAQLSRINHLDLTQCTINYLDICSMASKQNVKGYLSPLVEQKWFNAHIGRTRSVGRCGVSSAIALALYQVPTVSNACNALDLTSIIRLTAEKVTINCVYPNQCLPST